MDPRVTKVDYECPKCWRVLKPPLAHDELVTWVDGDTRHYAHAGCYEVTEEEGGLDNGGTVVATS